MEITKNNLSEFIDMCKNIINKGNKVYIQAFCSIHGNSEIGITTDNLEDVASYLNLWSSTKANFIDLYLINYKQSII